ncbi:MAG: MoxR family ATPase [Chloroflexi bacterium]|nr:MAG: MoxR family ATPase [Chloroflexota bacterium]
MIQQTAERVIANVEKVIVGKRPAIELILIALLCEGHVLIEDVPGIGKTTVAKAIAKSLGCSFKRIQFTPDLLPSDVTGISYFNQRASDFEFRPGPVMSQIVLADEINRATPRTQSALLEAMEERQITVDGETRMLPRPFVVLATQNPIELEGTFPLPEAQIDRFLLQMRLGYPSAGEEGQMVQRFEHQNPLDDLQSVVGAEELQLLQAEVRSIRVEESVRDYVVAVVRATRQHPAVELGASPRGSLSLHRTAQALAAIRGRDFVIPDDVKYMAEFVLTHRLIISPQTRLRGRTADEILREIVNSVPVPVEK